MRHWNLLLEADKHLRKLERQASAGDPEARKAWLAALRRTGQHDRYIQAHAQDYHDAHRHHAAVLSAYRSGKAEEGDVGKASARIDIAADALDKAARGVGKVAGHYIHADDVESRHKVPGAGKTGEAMRRHAHIADLAKVHGHRGFHYSDIDGGRGEVFFNYRDRAEHFHRAVKHHYPKSDVRVKLHKSTIGPDSHSVEWDHG